MHRRVFFDITPELEESARGRVRTLGPLVLIPTADVLPKEVAGAFTPSADVLAGVVANTAKWLPLGPVLPPFRHQYVAFVHEDSAVRVRNDGEFRDMRAVDGNVTAADFVPAVCQPGETVGLVWAPLTTSASSCHHSVRQDGVLLHRRHVLIDNWWSTDHLGCLDVIPSEDYQRLVADGTIPALDQLHKQPRRNFATAGVPETKTQKRIQEQDKQDAEQMRALAERRRIADQRYQSSGISSLMIALIIAAFLGVIALFYYMLIEYRNEDVGMGSTIPGIA